ncbi:sigma-70 family RNA polymerase sigma factor [Olivibacter sitiensis]|uniref:sigma-70 family RNA polymerase sigma factor n=1 Tax=Olivibacter sitiensis TaxID=376470 RepID=UPI00040CD1E9|nr:RNA polymerase sigma factor RpoD/SigA [Olivibacter sitiensis]
MKQLKITESITNRESRSLSLYLTEIGKVDLLTAQDEVILTQKIRQGDIVALERLTKANLRFVVSVAKQYQHHGMVLGDLINEGNVGLIKAATRFDETKGFKFISYAVWWIRQSIISAIANQSRSIRIPINQIGNLSKIKKMQSQLEQELEREPSQEELATCLETTTEKIATTLNYQGRPLSFDAPMSSSEDGTLLEVIQNNEPDTDVLLLKSSLITELERALSILPDRQQVIIAMLYGLKQYEQHSLEEIAFKLQLTRERIRQLREKALYTLRHSSFRPLLEAYL